MGVGVREITRISKHGLGGSRESHSIRLSSYIDSKARLRTGYLLSSSPTASSVSSTVPLSSKGYEVSSLESKKDLQEELELGIIDQYRGISQQRRWVEKGGRGNLITRH